MWASAQNPQHEGDKHKNDTSDVFYRHLELNEVVVTGVAGDTKLKNSTAPIATISTHELRTAAATNFVGALARQPGLDQITTGSGIAKPIIRGLGFNRIVVMNDGVRQEGQQWGDEHGLEVDDKSVHTAEVLKGPASLMYGSDAMAGVLILHGTPAPVEGEIRGAVSGEYQTNNGLAGYSANIGGNQNGFVWDGRVSQKWAHQYQNRYDGYVPDSQFRERNGHLRLGLNKAWGHSHLIGSIFHQTPSIVEGERDSVTGELLRGDVAEKTYHKATPFQQVRHYKAVWDNSVNLPHGWLKAVVGYQQNRRQEYEEADECELDFRLQTITYDVRYLSPDMNGWKLAAGANGMRQQSENLGEETLIPAYKLFDIGTYATATRSLRNWTLNGGVRYDHRHLDFHSRNFGSLSGSLGAVWNVNKHWNVRLNAARGYRAPNMSELGSDGVHEGTLRYELGNAALKPEHSVQGDLGVDFMSRYVSAQAALFVNRIDGYIFAERLNEIRQGMRTYRYTQGDARLMGAELGVDIHPIHSLHFSNTFSFVSARQLHQPALTRYLPFTPAPRWTSELKYELTHDGRTLNNTYIAAGLQQYFAQHHYYKADDTETSTPAYMLLNVSAGTDLRLRGRKVAELYVVADNLLDKAYQSHLSRLKYGDVNVATGRQGVYDMGRNVTFKLIIPFTVKAAEI
ncbi:MAG: TonB-dependent receptor [Bacteroidaceae bacterium]|nr:TonB-dependent receptor [Bacteroidaceae bacterium]